MHNDPDDKYNPDNFVFTIFFQVPQTLGTSFFAGCLAITFFFGVALGVMLF